MKQKLKQTEKPQHDAKLPVSGSCGFPEEMFERLVNSHFSLFRRLNQINNKEPQSEATQKALEEARDVNRFFSDKDSPRIVQS